MKCASATTFLLFASAIFVASAIDDNFDGSNNNIERRVRGSLSDASKNGKRIGGARRALKSGGSQKTAKSQKTSTPTLSAQDTLDAQVAALEAQCDMVIQQNADACAALATANLEEAAAVTLVGSLSTQTSQDPLDPTGASLIESACTGLTNTLADITSIQATQMVQTAVVASTEMQFDNLVAQADAVVAGVAAPLVAPTLTSCVAGGVTACAAVA